MNESTNILFGDLRQFFYYYYILLIVSSEANCCALVLGCESIGVYVYVLYV